MSMLHGINQNTNFKIGLYDSENNATHIMDLIDISNSSLAEKYAVFSFPSVRDYERIVPGRMGTS